MNFLLSYISTSKPSRARFIPATNPAKPAPSILISLVIVPSPAFATFSRQNLPCLPVPSLKRLAPIPVSPLVMVSKPSSNSMAMASSKSMLNPR